MGDTCGLTSTEVKPLLKEPDEATKGYIMQHTMYRIKDPKKSLPFYTGVLGMRLLQKLDFPSLKFTIYFLGYQEAENIPTNNEERSKWALSRPGTIELAHNWGSESDPDVVYHTGNSDPRGFGHIGICVPDVDAACSRCEKLGVEFIKKPREGKMMGIAFIKDPDGYWVELFSANDVGHLDLLSYL